MLIHRLLLCAEMMIQKEQKNAHHLSPRLVFVKNKCEPKKSNFQEVAAYENIYKQLFNGSKLKIFSSEEDCERLNIVTLPDLSGKNKSRLIFQKILSAYETTKTHRLL